MILHFMIFGSILFVNVESEDVLNSEAIKYQTAIDERFKQVYNLLRDQAIQINEQREKIGILETQIHNQNQRCQIETLQDNLKIRTGEIDSLKKIVNRQQKEITQVKKQLAYMTSRQIKCETNSMKLKDIISKQGLSHKDCCENKLQTSGPSAKTTAPNSSLLTSGSSLPNYRGRRLLIGTATTVSPPIIPTAFYAYLSHPELNINNHHTLIFDTVTTNYNGGYSSFTGVFTVPVSGVYGFTYTIRMGCNRSNALGPFEIVRNSEVEGVVFISETGCASQGTATATVIIHANSGDKVYIRSQTVHPMDGNVYSDTNGRSSFAGWQIFSDQ